MMMMMMMTTNYGLSVGLWGLAFVFRVGEHGVGFVALHEFHMTSHWLTTVV